MVLICYILIPLYSVRYLIENITLGNGSLTNGSNNSVFCIDDELKMVSPEDLQFFYDQVNTNLYGIVKISDNGNGDLSDVRQLIHVNNAVN